MGSLIQSTLNGLKERLRLVNGKLILQSEGGEVGEVICEFNESTNQENILSFEKNTGWKLPDDYKDFLLLHNGANIFDDPEYGGGLELYRLEEIKNIHEEMEFPNHWCPIGYYQNGTGYVCIDTKQTEENLTTFYS
ncbi:SMI1/KNR4 family protein [Fictibacillus sp. Mic-4]|uniref:SMI1/KNR4 family protein n=1 Tax=Fictibacillus sp. Mic-4 TaxID=3132826 RepID=UPI003CEE1E2C